MAKRDVGTMGTGAVADGSQLEFDIADDYLHNGTPAIWVNGLAGVEKAYLWMKVGVTSPTWRQVYIDDAAVEFTTTKTHITLQTEGLYGITKDSTVGSLTVALEGL